MKKSPKEKPSKKPAALAPVRAPGGDCIKPHPATNGDISKLFDPKNADPAAEPSIATIVGFAWAKAQDGLRAIVEFGALLIEVETWLKKRGGFNGLQKKLGVGLKAWLAEHAPEVDYKTAMGYKYAASGLLALADKARNRPLLVLMGEQPLTDAEEEAAREQVLSLVSSSSLRLLKAAAKAAGPACDPADRNQGRHPKGAEEGVEEALDRAAALAAADTALADGEMAERLQPLHVWAVENDGVGTLSDKGLDMLLDGIGEIRDRALAVRKARAAAARREARA